MEFSELKGKVLKRIWIKPDETEVEFTCDNGDKYKLYHDQDCCERVYLAETIGDLDSVIGSEILLAEEVSYDNEHPDERSKDYAQRNPYELSDSFTWTFYKLATFDGYVTLRWVGSSNGYYSQSVDFVKC